MQSGTNSLALVNLSRKFVGLEIATVIFHNLGEVQGFFESVFLCLCVGSRGGDRSYE